MVIQSVLTQEEILQLCKDVSQMREHCEEDLIGEKGEYYLSRILRIYGNIFRLFPDEIEQIEISDQD